MPVGEAILKVHQVAAFTLVALVALHVARPCTTTSSAAGRNLRRMWLGGASGERIHAARRRFHSEGSPESGTRPPARTR